jgi:DNA modification methylase
MGDKSILKINVKPDIKTVNIDKIKPAPYNPRIISNEALIGLRKSLESFGYLQLLVVNKRNMHIVAGNQRYKIIKQAGIKSLPVIMVDVDDMQEKLENVTLNNKQIEGCWTEALIPIIEQARKECPDYYIDLRLDQLREEVYEFEVENMGAGKTLPDDIPDPAKDIITERGDLWILGEHRLLCGNSLEEENVAFLMDGKKAKLFATDPPYLVNYTGADRPKNNKDWSSVYWDEGIKDAYSFFGKYLSLGLKFIEANAGIYMWHATTREDIIKKVWSDLGILLHQKIIWVKPCAVMTYACYHWRHEPCLFGWRKGNRPYIKPQDMAIGTVWDVDLLRTAGPSTAEYYADVWKLDWEGKNRPTDVDHPTVKPTEVFAIPMRVHTRVGDICYEPFSGSGTQIIAAERLNRRCYAMEDMPVFVDVAVKRWEDYTGKKAKRIKKR